MGGGIQVGGITLPNFPPTVLKYSSLPPLFYPHPHSHFTSLGSSSALDHSSTPIPPNNFPPHLLSTPHLTSIPSILSTTLSTMPSFTLPPLLLYLPPSSPSITL